MEDGSEDMRLIGHLKNESSAKTLADYLVSLDIRNMVEPDADGWAIWIYSEDQIEAGRQALTNYLHNPTDSKFQNAQQNAAVVQERERREQEAYSKRVRTPDRIWSSTSIAPVTLVLIVISVAVTLLMNVPSLPVENLLSISLPEVFRGQIWRLITPIFLHFGLLHILFNMLMLRDLGSLVEIRRGARTLIILVLVIGVGSNLGQYYYGGPGFGGMSGVLYGLMGYAWLRGKTDPASGLFLSQSTVAVMLIWFFLCLFGVISNVANVCHAVGLVMGMIIGVIPSTSRK